MRIIISGGGTGGHIYPAIAIADKIMRKEPESRILFVGTKKGMESRLVPESGYEIRYISARGFNRANLFKNVNTAVDLLRGCRQVARLIKEFKPDMVIGTGGYVSLPVLFTAARKGLPVYIHEQNAFPGLANRILGRYAKKIFISFQESEQYFKGKGEIVVTGNPIRNEFIVSGIFNYREKLGINAGDFFILSFGGSRGAEKINDAILDLAKTIGEVPNVRLLHITGRNYYDTFKQKLKESINCEKHSDKITVMPYTERIHEYMLASDLVICRSGAITVAELTACGKPAILIPSPNVTANHQYYNAKSVADKGGAVLILEKDLIDGRLENIVMRLMNNKEALNKMSKISSSLGRMDGADAIFAELMVNKHIS